MKLRRTLLIAPRLRPMNAHHHWSSLHREVSIKHKRLLARCPVPPLRRKIIPFKTWVMMPSQRIPDRRRCSLAVRHPTRCHSHLYDPARRGMNRGTINGELSRKHANYRSRTLPAPKSGLLNRSFPLRERQHTGVGITLFPICCPRPSGRLVPYLVLKVWTSTNARRRTVAQPTLKHRRMA